MTSILSLGLAQPQGSTSNTIPVHGHMTTYLPAAVRPLPCFPDNDVDVNILAVHGLELFACTSLRNLKMPLRFGG